jgi:hypothetical protein
MLDSASDENQVEGPGLIEDGLLEKRTALHQGRVRIVFRPSVDTWHYCKCEQTLETAS